MKLTKLRPDQASYIGVSETGPVQAGSLPLLIGSFLSRSSESPAPAGLFLSVGESISGLKMGTIFGFDSLRIACCRTDMCVSQMQYGSTNCAQVLQRKFKRVLTPFLAESGVV